MIGIYKITNKLNGKSYIGQSIHCGKRFDEHFSGKEQFIDKTINVEGIQNFTFEILDLCTREELDEKESYYIKKYNTLYPDGYNMIYKDFIKKEKQKIDDKDDKDDIYFKEGLILYAKERKKSIGNLL